MAYEKLRLGVSPITKNVYVGRLNKDETMWIDKKDITEDFLRCCISYFEENTENTISADGKPLYIITIKKAKQNYFV